MGSYGKCFKIDCHVELNGFNSKVCKLMEHRVCLDHVMPENHDCPKVIYAKYIRRSENILRKYGQNVSSGRYSVRCETCGYVSDFPHLIEHAGAELEDHLKNSEKCLQNKKTFLMESV